MAVDIQKFFNQELPAALAKDPVRVRQIGAKYQLNVVGEGGGAWFVDASDSGPKVELGNPGHADVAVTIGIEDFQKLLEDPKHEATQLFLAGKLKIAGNHMLAMKLQALFERH